MKKIAGLLLALGFMLGAMAGALAEDSTEVQEVALGTGATSFGVYVQQSAQPDALKFFDIKTDETTLLAALQGVALVDGEEVSWGFNVTTVDGVKADYDGKGEYWSILQYDPELQELVNLETPIATTPVAGGEYYVFYLGQ